MIESELVLSADTAQILIKIARCKRLTNTDHGRYLPPSWRTLHELTKLDDGTWAQAAEQGVIRAWAGGSKNGRMPPRGKVPSPSPLTGAG